jgi:two-component system, NarL family, nitrate/nitrite response regulator NarL
VERSTVLLADGRARRRASLRALLEREGFLVCAEVDNGPAAVEAAVREQPDVCLLDAAIDGEMASTTGEISARVGRSHVVIVHARKNGDALLAALDAGASGYLPAETNPRRLAPTVRAVLAGEAAVPRSLVAVVIADYRRRGERRRLARELRNREIKLTRREWEVLELLADGLTSGAAAERLGVGAVTVRSHVSALVRKLGVADREAAIRLLRR